MRKPRPDGLEPLFVEAWQRCGKDHARFSLSDSGASWSCEQKKIFAIVRLIPE